MREVVIRCCPLCPEKLFVASRVAARLREDQRLEVRREGGTVIGRVCEALEYGAPAAVEGS